ATNDIYTLSLHDALPISEAEAEAKRQAEEEAKRKAEAEAEAKRQAEVERVRREQEAKRQNLDELMGGLNSSQGTATGGEGSDNRSEEHTSELQSRENLVC